MKPCLSKGIISYLYLKNSRTVNGEELAAAFGTQFVVVAIDTRHQQKSHAETF